MVLFTPYPNANYQKETVSSLPLDRINKKRPSRLTHTLNNPIKLESNR